MAANELHVIHLDTLLNVLGGFAQPPKNIMVDECFYEPWLMNRILLIARKKRAEHKELEDLSQGTGKSVKALSMQIGRIRRGHIPENWRDAKWELLRE